MFQEIAPPLCEGRYRLIGELGVGGMATVYRAYDSRLQVERAIKVLAPHLAARASIRKRFEIEASTMAKLHHPNIVTVHDIGSDGNRCFIVMEMLEGGSLMGRVDRHGVLPPRMAGAIIADMIEALGVAHDKGVVHRDIKPHNVLLSNDNKPKVTDFGIASVQQEDRSMTKTGAVMGTWAYMAPEQRIDAKSADARADLYSSAASLYALLTGKEPFDLYTTQLHEEMFQGIPEPLAKVIQKGCSYKADDRYQTAKEMTQAIRDILEELPEDPPNTPPLAHVVDESTPGYTAETLSPASFADYSESGLGSMPPAAAAAAGGATFDGSLWLAEEEDAPPPVLPGSDSRPPTTASGTMEPPITLTPGQTQPEYKRTSQSFVGVLLLILVAAGALLYMNREDNAPQRNVGITAADMAIQMEALKKELMTSGRSAEKDAELQQLRDELETTKNREEAQKLAKERKKASNNSASQPAKKSRPTAAPSPTAAPRAETPPATTSKPAATEAAKTFTPAAATAAPPEVSNAGKGEGELRVNSLPWANVTIDGKPAGRTGRAHQLSVGMHTIGLITKDGRRKTQQVTIRAGKVEKRCWNFDLDAPCPR